MFLYTVAYLFLFCNSFFHTTLNIDNHYRLYCNNMPIFCQLFLGKCELFFSFFIDYYRWIVMKSKHPFFCNCNSCKQKRKSNIFYLIGIIVVFIILFYQMLLLLFITTRLNVVILLFEFIMLCFLVFLVFFWRYSASLNDVI